MFKGVIQAKGGNKRRIGTKYEEMAAEYLKNKGYRILERNYRNRCGELDIIAKQDSVIVVVEVKFRKSGAYGDPLEAVDRNKQRRICRAALYYYVKCGLAMDVPCRFDVIAIYGDETIKHIENAFEFVGSV